MMSNAKMISNFICMYDSKFMVRIVNDVPLIVLEIK
jgi:hypothetical protein